MSRFYINYCQKGEINMAKQRSYSVTVNFTTDSKLEALTLTGTDAESFYVGWMNGLNREKPFHYVKEDGSEVSFMFHHVTSVVRSAQEETDTTDGQCKDLTL